MNMANKCTICRHKERAGIDKYIIEGKQLSKITKIYDVSYSAVIRHKHKCLEDKVSDKLDWHAAEIANEILELSFESARDAKDSGELKSIGSILSNPAKIFEIVSKTSDAGENSCGLAEMRLELRMMRSGSGESDKSDDKDNISEIDEP